jgi:tRNA threonylcarbamoyladenosine biosynthesis protein TsaE
VVLAGPLGVGKTFFVRGLLRKRGLPSEERVTSPTFALVQEYELSPRVLHADLYRVKRGAEVTALGLSEERTRGAILLVEWGTPFVQELGGDALVLDFGLIPGAARGRRAEVRAEGSRSNELLGALALNRA